MIAPLGVIVHAQHAGARSVRYLEECIARGLSGGATLVAHLALIIKLPDSGS